MIFQTSSIDPKKPADTPVVPHKITPIMPFFGQTLKQHWTLGLLVAILYFFALPISLLMGFSLSPHMVPDVNDLEQMYRDTLAWADGVRYFLIVSMSILAVVVSCVMQNYLHSKVSVDFYHSLPITRGRLMTVRLIAGYLLIFVPCLVMYSAALIEIAAYGYFSEALLPVIAATVNETLVYSIFFYGLAALTGVIIGSTSIHFLLSCLFVFLLPLEYLVSYAFLEIFHENMWFDWYVNESVMSKFSPALRLCLNESYLSPAELLCMLVIAAAFFVLAYFVYLRYRSERAGNTVIFPLVGEIIKYAVIYMLTLAGGLLFYAITETGVWTIFGMVCGAVLSLMLTNTILHKTAKAMFAGIKVFLIYSGVIVAMMIVLLTNLFCVNTFVPSPKATAQVDFCLANNTPLFRFTEPEQIEAIYRLYTESPKLGDYYTYADGTAEYDWVEPEPEDNIRYDRTMRINVVFYPKIGFPIAKEVTIYSCSLSDELLNIILNGDEFNEQYHKMIEKMSLQYYSDWGSDYLFRYDKQTGYFVRYYSEYGTKESQENIKSALLQDMENVTVNYDYFQRPVLKIGYCRIEETPSCSDDVYLPVFDGMDNTEKTLIQNGFIGSTRDEYIDNLAEGLDKVTVYDRQTDSEQVFTQKTDIREILNSCASSHSDRFYYSNDFTQIDARYTVRYELHYYEKYYGMYDEAVDEQSTSTDNLYYSEHTDWFLLGKIPACVK